MNRTLVALIVAAGLMGPAAVSIFAADAPAPAASQNAKHGRQPMAKLEEALAKLDLSADQKTQVEKIITDTKTKLQAIRAEAKTGDKDKAKEEAKTVIKGAREEIAKVLTKEQSKQLHELMKAERGANRRTHAANNA